MQAKHPKANDQSKEGNRRERSEPPTTMRRAFLIIYIVSNMSSHAFVLSWMPCVKKDGLEIARIIFPEEKDTTQTFSDDATVQKRSCDSAKSAGELQVCVRYVSAICRQGQCAVGVFRFQRHLNDFAVDAPNLPLNPKVSFFQINVRPF